MKRLVLDGRKLFQIRTDKNLTRDELGKMIGLNEPSIFKWENGINQPRAKRIKALCDALNVNPEDLFVWQEMESDTEKIIKKQNPNNLIFIRDKDFSSKSTDNNEFIDHMIKYFCEFDRSNFSLQEIIKILLNLKQ